MTAPTSPPLDRAVLLAATNHNPELAQEVLQMFQAELSPTLTQLTAAIQTQDFATASHLVHRLRGSACYCGAHALNTLSTALEAALQQPTPERATLQTHLSALQQEIHMILNYLQTQS